MARKGGSQLQVKITTNEELDEFVKLKGLIVLEVYTEWFGPCSPIQAALRKVKMEVSADDLQLGLVQCDNIEIFHRYLNRSEPFWLFVINEQVVFSMCGANATELANAIQKVISDLPKYDKSQMPMHMITALHELSFLEQQEANDIKKAKKDETRRQAENERSEFVSRMEFACKMVIKNIGDMGVTLLMPHASNRSVHKEIEETGNALNMTVKERAMSKVLPAHWKIINFDASERPENIPKALWYHIVNKEIFMICWKRNEGEDRPIVDICTELVQLFTERKTIQDISSPAMDQFPTRLPSILVPTPKTQEENDLLSDIASENSDDCEFVKDEINQIVASTVARVEESKEASEVKEEETDDFSLKQEFTSVLSKIFSVDKFKTLFNASEEDGDTEEEITDTGIKLQGIWTPPNTKTMAMFVYLYFRKYTEQFVPPDPIPFRPHLLLIFAASRRSSLFPLIMEYRSDVLAYGYFTLDDPTKNIRVQLIATTNRSYEKIPKPAGLKLVLKLANETDDALYDFASCEPIFISRNAECGKFDCLPFFPKDYPSDLGDDDLLISSTDTKLKSEINVVKPVKLEE